MAAGHFPDACARVKKVSTTNEIEREEEEAKGGVYVMGLKD